MDRVCLSLLGFSVDWLPRCPDFGVDGCTVACDLQRYSAFPELSEIAKFPLRSAVL